MNPKKDIETPEEEIGEEEVDEKDETDEEEEKTMKSLEKSINKKVQEIIDATKEGKKFTKEVPILETSVMNPDLLLRKKAPFVKLSKQMEDFIVDLKSLAKGGIPRSMIKALSEGDDTAGGFLVPEEFNAEVIRYSSEAAIVRPRARIIPMTRDIVNFPKLDQSSDQFGGVELNWIEEGALKAESQPKFGKITLKAKKLIGLCPVSDELLEDAAVNVANFLVALFGEALAYEEDKQFLIGTGMGKPLGITVGSCNVVNRNTTDAIEYVDLEKMMTALPAWADTGAIWLTTKGGQEKLLNIKSTTGFPLLLPGFSLGAGVPNSMLGYPLVLTDKLPAVGVKGDINLVNFSWYWIGDRGPLAVTSSIHDRFRYDETTFRFVKRVDGQPANCKPFVVLDVPK